MTAVKKIAVGCLSLALVASLAIGGSLAFLTDSEETTNVFSVGDLDITLEEPNWDPDEGIDVIPGSTMMKDPVITAIENNSYMRVYTKFIDDNDGATKGNVITDAARLALIKQTMYYDSTFNSTVPSGAINVDKKYSLAQLAAIAGVNNGINTTKFAADPDHSTAGVDCYKYKGIFNENDKAILFTNIVIPTDWNQTQMAKIGKFKIVVYAQAIQSTGFANATEAFAALDAEVAAGTILKDHGTVGE